MRVKVSRPKVKARARANVRFSSNATFRVWSSARIKVRVRIMGQFCVRVMVS